MKRSSFLFWLLSHLILAKSKRQRADLHSERAVALVELAIILPLQMMLLVASYEAGIMLREYMRAKSITDAMALKGSATPQAASGCWDDYLSYHNSPSPTNSTLKAHWIVIDRAKSTTRDFYPDALNDFHHYDGSGNIVAGPHFTTMRIRDEPLLRTECGDAPNEEQTFGVQFTGWRRMTFFPVYLPLTVRSKVGVVVTTNLPAPVDWIPGDDQDSDDDGSETEEDHTY